MQESENSQGERTGTDKRSLGLLQIYTGEGKGKTTAALGQAVRAVGHDMRVLIIQFLKGRHTGELETAKRLAPYLTILQYGGPRFIFNRKPDAEELAMAQAGLQRGAQAMANRECDILVFDELNSALAIELLSLEEVMAVLANRPPGIEVIITGRNVRPELVEMADLVSEVRLIKHPYEKGIPARKGTEF